MAEPITTDLFKFVAVRPAQRVTEKETRRTIIRDERADNPDGAVKLAQLARELSHSGVAPGRWRELDLSPIESLAEAHRELVLRYENFSADEHAPDGRELLNEAAPRARTGRDPQLLRVAWDALYTAHLTGPDAGPLLEKPIAALRVLHFARLLDEDQYPAPTAALEALRATPAIPTVFDDSIRLPAGAAPGTTGVTAQGGPREANNPERSTRLRELAKEIDATERLLATVATAPALTARVIAGPTEQTGGWVRSEFDLRNAPALHHALSGQISREQAAILDRLRVAETSPVTDAAQALQSHLMKLSEQAIILADDREYQGYVRELRGILVPSLYEGPKISALLDDPGTSPDVNVAGHITPLGVGDLKVVKQTLLAYLPGEVAHIENVLKGESKERKHRKLDRTETTLFASVEETKETERDTQSTDRFELKRETEQTVKEDMSVKAGLTVTASFGPVVTTATGDFAYSTSKQDSQKSSSNFARDLVDRSVSKVQIKTRTERTTKTLNEVEEINTHLVDNAQPGADHVIGVYRWVDKRYRAQVYNYGVRLLLEFVVPEPAAFFRASQLRRALKSVNATPPAAFLNTSDGPLTVADITETDYLLYASRYNVAGVTPPPQLHKYIGISLIKEGVGLGQAVAMEAKDFLVPEGYVLIYYSATASILSAHASRFSLQIGPDTHLLLHKPWPPDPDVPDMTIHEQGTPKQVVNWTGAVRVTVAAYDVRGFAVNAQGVCLRDDAGQRTLQKWQLQTFDKIQAAYQALKNAYDQKVAQAEAAGGIAIEGRNPGLNRTIEKDELKKLCITMMTGQHFKQFNAMTDPADKPAHHPEVQVLEALAEGRIVQFFEQAFEWEQMTYLFYPYFWGRKRNWVEVSNLSDPDPLFARFLTAGAARVVVPVPMPYADAVQYLLQSKETDLGKKVWHGGERPTLGSDLYISITEEIRNQTDDLAGATPEGTPWEFTVPTTLVWLQPDAGLPKFT